MEQGTATFDARGTRGVAIWLPRECVALDGEVQDMMRVDRLSVIVVQATRNWLRAHGAPDAFVNFNIRNEVATPQENAREANEWVRTISLYEGPVRATACDHLNKRPMVARWGSDWTEGDVVWTIAAVVNSAIRDAVVAIA